MTFYKPLILLVCIEGFKPKSLWKFMFFSMLSAKCGFAAETTALMLQPVASHPGWRWEHNVSDAGASAERRVDTVAALGHFILGKMHLVTFCVSSNWEIRRGVYMVTIPCINNQTDLWGFEWIHSTIGLEHWSVLHGLIINQIHKY